MTCTAYQHKIDSVAVSTVGSLREESQLAPEWSIVITQMMVIRTVYGRAWSRKVKYR
jgi:hypothetical protein